MNNQSPLDLTRNQSLVLTTLAKAGSPMSAYTILDALRGDGFRAPLQVYRALEKLVELGRVHKLESLNAFMACTHPSCDDHPVAAFAICEDCGGVSEITHKQLSHHLRDLAISADFALKRSIIELHGTCHICTDAQS